MPGFWISGPALTGRPGMTRPAMQRPRDLETPPHARPKALGLRVIRNASLYMPKAYWITTYREIKDPAKLAAYSKLAPLALGAFWRALSLAAALLLMRLTVPA